MRLTSFQLTNLRINTDCALVPKQNHFHNDFLCFVVRGPNLVRSFKWKTAIKWTWSLGLWQWVSFLLALHKTTSTTRYWENTWDL